VSIRRVARLQSAHATPLPDGSKALPQPHHDRAYPLLENWAENAAVGIPAPRPFFPGRIRARPAALRRPWAGIVRRLAHCGRCLEVCRLGRWNRGISPPQIQAHFFPPRGPVHKGMPHV